MESPSGRGHLGVAGAMAAPLACGCERQVRVRPRCLDALIAEATLDCRDEQEAAIGIFTMIQDNLVVPFQTQVLGVGFTVDDIGSMQQRR